jgi:hypothetical protein
VISENLLSLRRLKFHVSIDPSDASNLNSLVRFVSPAAAYLAKVSTTRRIAPTGVRFLLGWPPRTGSNFSPNRRLLGYNVDSPIPYRAIRVIFWLCGT